MKQFINWSVSAVVCCAVLTSVSRADTIVYNNSTISGYFWPANADYNEEFLDYGSSSGGLVSKFEIGYATNRANPGTLYIRFWQGTNRYSLGSLIKTITITDLDGSPDGNAYAFYKEYILPEEERFQLPAGNFGYSYEFSWSYNDSGPLLASGGLSNQNYYWLYYINKWYGSQQISGGYAGFYMKVYTGPALADITCDISGNKFNDVDGDGTWDAGEPGLGDWEIYADINNNDQFDPGIDPNAVTDPNGVYFFENLDSPATYTIREVMKSGWTQTLPGGSDYEYTVVTEPNNVYGPYDFGNTDQVISGSVQGTITHDSNGDTVINPAEPKLSGWTVYADINGNTKYDTGEPSAISNVNGDYQLTGLAPGTYTIAEVVKDGWVQTYPTTACTHSVTITISDLVVENIDFGNHTFTGYGGGSGTQTSPYLIYNHLHLQAVGAHSSDWGKYFKLMDDIDLSKYIGEQFNMIGEYHYITGYDAFEGVFDGNGYTVRNFSYNYTGATQVHIGLFGYVWNGEVRNLRVENVDIDTREEGVHSAALVGQLEEGSLITNCHVANGSVIVEKWGAGGLIGRNSGGTVQGCTVALNSIQGGGDSGGIVSSNYEGTISNCSFEGTLYAPGEILEGYDILMGYDTGGIAGSNQSTISQCYANATIDGIGALGGLVGQNSGGVISQCYAQGTVLANSPAEMGLAGSEAGGLVGVNTSGGTILDSYSMTNVSGSKKIGGLVGVSSSSSGTCVISNCYAAGTVSGSYTKGGLVGWNIDDLTVITDCFWDTQTTGLAYSDGGTGLPTVDMQNKQTYLDAGWDFTDETTNGTDDIWKLCDGVIAYPGLTWTDPSICGASELVLYPIADAYVKSSEPDTNFGSEAGLNVGKSGTTVYRSFLKFDMTQIPAGYRIASATLEIQSNYIPPLAIPVGVWQTSEAWNESELNWNNKKTAYDTLPADTCVVSIGTNRWDVTQDADDTYCYDRQLSIVLQSTDESADYYTSFWSREFTGDYMPKLVVQYVPIFGGGNGTADDPYQIWTAEQMNSIGLYRNRWAKTYKLMADISLAAYTGTTYNRIGPTSLTATPGPFTGVFDGNYHTISDFSYSTSSTDYIGLFGYVHAGTVRNLGLISPSIINQGSTNYVGALAGFLSNADISGCWVQGGSVSGTSYTGGLVGAVSLSCIAECDSSASVSGGNYTGGLIGSRQATPAVSWISDCYATGSVNGSSYVGGFMGRSSDVLVENCYSTGSVVGSSNTGGFSGYNSNSILPGENVTSCFWDYQTSGTTQSAAGTGMPTAEMKNLPMFLNAGWDFVSETSNGASDTWAMPMDSYPVFWRQLATPPALPGFAGGDGTAATPYLISNAEQLNSIGHNPRLMDKHFRLTQDIDMKEVPYWIIGQRPRSFTGIFDGDNHSIFDLSMISDDLNNTFGFIGSIKGTNAVLRNLRLVNTVVSGEQTMRLGGFVGRSYGGILENCHLKNANITGYTITGGLIGETYYFSKTLNCSVMGGSVSGSTEEFIYGVGGLIGNNTYGSSVENSFAWTDVSGSEYVGGLVGSTRVSSPITNCYSKGSVTGTSTRVGGLVGGSSNTSNLTSCYTTAYVSGPSGEYVGAFAGSISSGVHPGNFWDNTINPSLPGIGYTSSSPTLDIEGLSTSSLQIQATFDAKSWDFDTVWDMRCEGMNYPRLQNEPMLPGDFVCPEGVELNDLLLLTDDWMAVGSGLVGDIAPLGAPDGKVNLLDYCVIAENWMLGTD